MRLPERGCLLTTHGRYPMPEYRMVVTYNVTAEDEAEAVRQFSADRAHSDGWLSKVEAIEVDEQT